MRSSCASKSRGRTTVKKQKKKERKTTIKTLINDDGRIERNSLSPNCVCSRVCVVELYRSPAVNVQYRARLSSLLSKIESEKGEKGSLSDSFEFGANRARADSLPAVSFVINDNDDAVMRREQ